MNRKLYSSPRRCSFNCKYCFRTIDDYKNQEIFNSHAFYDGFDIIYPSCDSEIIINKELLDYIEKSILVKDYTIISFSTKAKMSNNVIEKINLINQILTNKNKGFIKVSVSITNISMVDELEPFASSFEERIETLKLLNEYRIPNSVILKPILPFIDTEEYMEIIDITSKYTKCFLIGGLYISEGTEFYNQYIKGRYKVVKKNVEWLDSKPEWSYLEDKQREDSIKSHFQKMNLKCFEI
jgi:DNA repair photolyase